MEKMDGSDDDTNSVSMSLQIKYSKLSREVAVALRIPRMRQSGSRGTNNERIAWELVLHTFPDNGQYSTLDTILIQYSPRVCVLSPELAGKVKGEAKKIKNLLELHEIHVVTAANRSRDTEIETDVCRLIGKEALLSASVEENRDFSFASLAMLIRHHELMSDADNFGTYTIISRDISSVMQLDAVAISALNLLPQQGAAVSTFSSVFQVLNRGKTAMGKRLLQKWIRLPLLDIDLIQQRHDMVDMFLKNSSIRNELLHEGMNGLPDFDKLSYRLLYRKNTIKLGDLVSLYDAIVDVLPKIASALNSPDMGRGDEVLLVKFRAELSKIMSNFSGYIELIEDVVNLNSRPNFIVNASHDEELTHLKCQWDDILVAIDQEHANAKSSIGGDIKCDKDKVREFVFRVTDKKEERKLAKISNVHICQVLANGVHFTTGELKALAKQHRDIRTAYEERQTHLIQAAIDIATTYVPVIEAGSQILAELDVLLGFSHAAAHAGDGYCRPHLSNECAVSVSAARHPCVELQDGMSFIPNDYEFDREKSRFQIITGPNMGGKSTYIRQLGIIAVMAQIGSFVPAQSATLPIFDRLLARVGAGDSQQRGVSTFMAEMLEAALILEQATSKSLVIVDELGRGTSTFDGFGLAFAISHYLLTKTKCTCMFATHFHELTSLEHEPCGGVVNKHVTAHTDNGHITMVYEVNPGPCLKSFGINVAELAQFPQQVVNQAKRKAIELERCGNVLNKYTGTHGAHQYQNNGDQLDKFLRSFIELPLDQYDDTSLKVKLKEIAS